MKKWLTNIFLTIVKILCFIFLFFQVAVFVVVGLVLAGAALGYWIVRKFVISEDGSVDVGVAHFVKWGMRLIASTFIFQVCYSSHVG